MKFIIEKITDAFAEALKVVPVCVCLLLALGSRKAMAQSAGTYLLFGPQPGTQFNPQQNGTNLTSIPATSTNVFWTYTTNGATPGTNTFTSPGGILSLNTNLLIFSCSEFDYASITWGFTGTATSTNSLLAFPSYDNGVTFSAVPILQYLLIAPGAAAFITNSVPDLHGVTHLAFTLRSQGTTPATNVIGEITFKVNKIATRQATH